MKKSLLLLTVFSLLSIFASAKGVGLKEVPALITTTYIFAFIFLGVFLSLAALISNMIAYEIGKNSKDQAKRKMWFWIFAFLGPVSFYLYNFLIILPTVKKGPAIDKFSMHVPISSAIFLVSYIVIGFVLSKMLKRGKLGNWFPSKD